MRYISKQNETNYRLHGVEFLTICPGNIDLKNLMLQIKHELNGEAVAEKWSTISSLTYIIHLIYVLKTFIYIFLYYLL